MARENKEVWLRGPLAEVPVLLQPIAHALLQASEELDEMFEGFSDVRLWLRPAGVASPGFHLQHLTGVLDRLFTYAEGNALSVKQLQALDAETKSAQLSASQLVILFKQQVAGSIARLPVFQHQLTAIRYVGREKIESTVMGLLMHAAEHTMRHIGQLHVTVKVLNAGEGLFA